MGTWVTSDKLGFDTRHRPGALARYFAERWLEEPSAKGEEIIAWLLEAALGKNAMYFIEKTKEYVDAWGGSGEVVPANAFDDFVITGDPVEDTLIPHAILVWTCMNGRPWSEGVYHRWLDSLLAAGSAEAAYLAASLWPAPDLMTKVAYRPVQWLVYRGQIDAEAERLILAEMLQGIFGQRSSLYGLFEYDDVPFPNQLPEQYIERHGFIHPICGLVQPIKLEWNIEINKRIQEVLAAPSWSEGVKGAAMLLYLSLKACNELRAPAQETLNVLEQKLFKLDERHINIINFHMDKIEKIDYNLIKDYLNYLIILYKKTIYNSVLSIKIFSKYMSIGLKTNDIIYIGKDFNEIICNLIPKEKEKVESWLEKQADDLRIKDVLLSTYMNKRIYDTDYSIINIDEELKAEQVYKRIEDIYGKIKYFDKIKLFINQAKIYSNRFKDLHKICDFINYVLKRETRTNFISSKFREDYSKIIYSWHPNRMHISNSNMFYNSNHIGLYLYYGILKQWREVMVYFTKIEKEFNLYSYTKNKIIENLYIRSTDDIEIKMNLYLNKIESNNLPYEEIKYELIMDSINIMKNNYDKILEYFKDKSKFTKFRKLILSNIKLFRNELRNSLLIELLDINSKSQNMIIY